MIIHQGVIMNKIKIYLFSALTGMLLISCAGTSPPNWFSNVKCKKNFICGVGVADGSRLQIAKAEAEQNARLEIGQNISANVSGLIRQATEEINDVSEINNFQVMAESVFDIELQDTQITKQEVSKRKIKKDPNQRADKGELFTVYVQMSYDEGKANERLLRKIEEDKKLYDAFRTTQLYDDMKKKVDEYRARSSN